MRLKNLALLIAAVFTFSYAHAQKFAVDTILKSGSINNRINIVFMGDGYASTEQAKFTTDVATLEAGLFNQFPFTQYKPFCNVFAIHVISAQSGARHPHSAADCPALTAQPVANPNNYFGSTFDYAGIHRYLMATNTAAITSVLQTNLPQYDLVIILVNTPYYGGAAEGSYAICSSADPTSAETILHEMGHSLAGLGDEYSYSGCGGIEEWNATQDTGKATCRWKAWFTKGVKNTDYTNVGTYLGANYCPTGWFRPESNCKMRTLGVPFCRVCVDRFVYAFNYYVNLIDNSSPVSSSVALGSGQTQKFSASFVLPTPNSLYITWKLDNVLVASNVSSYLVNANNISKGTHTLVLSATDTSAHCKTVLPVYTKTWTITSSSNSLVTLNAFAPLCFNSSPITLSGGLPLGGTYSGTGVSNGQFSPALSGPGTFTITYTLLGISISQNITVYALPNLALSTSNSGICAGNRTVLTASGAGSYSWSPTTALSSGSAPSVTANPASTITYTVTGSSNGCSKTLTSVITVNPIPAVSVTGNSTVCNGSTVVLSAGGATSYTWSPLTGLNSSSTPSVTASPVTTTTYSVTGTSNGCSKTVSTVVTVSSGMAMSVSSGATVCSGNAATLGASGASTYTWSPTTGLSSSYGSSVTAAPATTTTYTVTGVAGTCSQSKTIVVSVNSTPAVSISSGTSSLCSGNSTTLTATGAATYTWASNAGLSATNTGTVTAAPTSTTTYSVTGTSNGCSKTVTTVLTVSPMPVVAVSPNGASICSGSTVTLTASGAASYLWTPSTRLTATTGNAVAAGPTITTTYVVSGTANGCTRQINVVVAVNNYPIIGTSSNATVCNGTSVTIGASGATSYNWSPAAGLNTVTGAFVSASPSSSTTYTVTGSNGVCAASRTIVVSVGGPPSMAATTNAAICNGSAVPLSASGATTYTWSPATGLSATSGPSVSAAPSVSTTYVVTGTTNGCSKSLNVVVGVGAVPTLSTSSNATICSGTSTMLGVSGASTYTWSPATTLNNPTASVVSAAPAVSTTYTVTGSNNGCNSSRTISVTVNAAPPITVSPNVTVCSGSVLSLTAAGASSYNWVPATGLNTNTGTVVVSVPTTTTTYVVTGTANGCSKAASVVVTVNNPAALSYNVVNPASGSSTGSIDLTATGGTGAYTYRWSNGQNTQDIAGIAAGTYMVTVTSGACNATASVNLSAIVSGCDTIKSVTFLSTSGTATFVTWSGIPGVYKYILRLRKRGTTIWTSTQSVLAPNTAAYFSGLSLNTTYEVQIQTQCNSAGTSVSNFTASRLVTTLIAREEEDGIQEDSSPADATAPFSLALYPNPNNGQMSLLFTGVQDDELTIQVFDLAGKMIYNQISASLDGANVLPVNLTDIPAGTYILTATRKEDRIVKKFIKF